VYTVQLPGPLIHIPQEQAGPVLTQGTGFLFRCETSWLPHFLDNRLTNGGEAVRLTAEGSEFESREKQDFSPLQAVQSCYGSHPDSYLIGKAAGA
jgi:hypothetical protein